MPTTKFPYGVSSYGAPVVPQTWGHPMGFNGPGSTSAPGSNVFFVNSATSLAADAAGSNGLSPGKPFKTLNYALTQTVNNNGDVIYVGPQHVETVTASGGLTFPTGTAQGVTVIMMGNYSYRATVNFTTATTAKVTIPANNVTWINPMFTNSIDALATGVQITGAGVTLVGVDWVDAVATCTAIQIITTAAANNLRILGYNYSLTGTITGTEPTEAIRIVGGHGHIFQDINIQGKFSTAVFNNITTAFLGAAFTRCYFNQLDTTPPLVMAVLTTSTGTGSQVVLVLQKASQTTYSTFITASNIMTFDIASSYVSPGEAPALIYT